MFVTMAPRLTRRTRLMMQEKLEIADEIRTEVSQSTLVLKYNVGLRALTHIKKGGCELIKTVYKDAISSNAKTIRSA